VVPGCRLLPAMDVVAFVSVDEEGWAKTGDEASHADSPLGAYKCDLMEGTR